MSLLPQPHAQTRQKQYYFGGQREEKAAFEASITFA